MNVNKLKHGLIALVLVPMLLNGCATSQNKSGQTESREKQCKRTLPDYSPEFLECVADGQEQLSAGQLPDLPKRLCVDSFMTDYGVVIGQ